MPFPIDEKYVKESEEKIGRIFPLWYRDKMMMDNGGEIEAFEDTWQLYPILNRASNKLLSRTCNDVVKETESAKEYPDFPSDAVAIAGNGTGDQLVFLPENEKIYSDKIYVWRHDSGECD